MDWVSDFQTGLKLSDWAQTRLEPSQKFDIWTQTKLSCKIV
ncbi:13093_t:CDS:1, partial [Gigaspora margarita]